MADKKDHIKGYGTPEMQGKRGDTLVDLNLSDEEIAEGDCVHFTIEDHPRLGSNLNDIKGFLLEIMERYDLIYRMLSESGVKNLPYAKFLKYKIANKEKALDDFLFTINKFKLLNSDNIHLVNLYNCIFELYEDAILNENNKRLLFCHIFKHKFGNIMNLTPIIMYDINDLFDIIDQTLLGIVKDIERQINNNKNTVLDDEKPTTNTLDDLKEQKDDPKRRPLGRDFKSAQWSKKPKLKTKTLAKDEQERFALRTFPQVYRIIDKAIQESGEGKTEWIVRAIIDRLMIDHPHLFEELKSQKDEFPEVRSDAKTGIDFMYE